MTTADTSHFSHPPRAARSALYFGVALIVLGVIALVFPFLTTLGATVIVGALLAASGVVMIVHAFGCRPPWRAALHAIWGFMSLAAGIAMIFLPLSGALALTLVLAAMFLATGASRIALALMKPRPRRWGLPLVSGIVSIVLAGLVIWTLPFALFWLPGIVVGVDLIFASAALLAMRDLAEPVESAP